MKRADKILDRMAQLVQPIVFQQVAEFNRTVSAEARLKLFKPPEAVRMKVNRRAYRRDPQYWTGHCLLDASPSKGLLPTLYGTEKTDDGFWVYRPLRPEEVHKKRFEWILDLIRRKQPEFTELKQYRHLQLMVLCHHYEFSVAQNDVLAARKAKARLGRFIQTVLNPDAQPPSMFQCGYRTPAQQAAIRRRTPVYRAHNRSSDMTASVTARFAGMSIGGSVSTALGRLLRVVRREDVP